MLIGRYDGKISAKFQTAFPKKFREVLGDTLIITRGFEQALLVIPESNWEHVLRDVEQQSVTTASARESKRFLLGGAAFVELDGKGRFILPEHLRTFGNLHDDIVFIGQETYVEIWDKKRWETYNQELAGRIETIVETLSHPVQKEARNE